MERISLILTALIDGESKAEASTIANNVEDQYLLLHHLLETRLAADPVAADALRQFTDHPASGRDTLIEHLRRSGTDRDLDVLKAAAAVMAQIDPEGSSNGNYALDHS
jgi:hypothetical protein